MWLEYAFGVRGRGTRLEDGVVGEGSGGVVGIVVWRGLGI